MLLARKQKQIPERLSHYTNKGLNRSSPMATPWVNEWGSLPFHESFSRLSIQASLSAFGLTKTLECSRPMPGEGQTIQ